MDARGPRFNQGAVAAALLTAFVFEARWVYPAGAAVLLLSALGGSDLGPLLRLFRDVIRPRLGPPKVIEDPRPPRFAAAIGTAVLALATAAAVGGVPGLADGLALIVAALAALAAVTGLCVGCEAYVWWRKRSATGWEPAVPAVPTNSAAGSDPTNSESAP
ncbi:MAG: DUF4395 domain-containing protein [Actinobacteria bacterium]|nr:DUF4395 domain-containing protein [Actinomycetota bacterium]